MLHVVILIGPDQEKVISSFSKNKLGLRVVCMEYQNVVVVCEREYSAVCAVCSSPINKVIILICI